MKLQSLLFDLDGTLANTLPLCIKVYQQTLAHFTGRDFTEEEVTAHFGLSEAGIFKRLLPGQWQEGLQYYHELYESRHDECGQPFTGIDKALKLLQSKGIRMGIITGKGLHTAEYTLQYLNLRPYFEWVEAGKDDGIAKAEAINKILQTWQIDPAYVAYIGDADTDIKEAAAAHVLPLAAEWAHTATIHRLPEDITPYASFSKVEDFITWIEQTIEFNEVENVGV